MPQVELQDPELNATDPHTRLLLAETRLLLAEYWKREAQHFAALSRQQGDELLRTWFVLKKYGHHPGRTDDRLSDCVRRALGPNVGIEPPKVGSNDGLGVCPIDATDKDAR